MRRQGTEQARSSDEAAVMVVERRGLRYSGPAAIGQPREQEEPLDAAEAIRRYPKLLVWEAYLERVKANGGAAGVDHETIEKFEEGLKRQAVSKLEPDVLRQLFPAAGQSCSDPKEDGRRRVFGRADGGGSCGADGR